MGSFARFGRYLKDFWKVVIRGENDDLQRQIQGVEAQVARLRERRIAKAKEREQSALTEVRIAVEKVQELHKSLLAAEEAASEFAAKLGDNAKKHMEAEMEISQKARMKFLQRQKECFQDEIKKEMEADSGVLSPHLISQLNKQAQATVRPKTRSDDSAVSSSSAGEKLEQVELLKQMDGEDSVSVVSLQTGDQAEASMQLDTNLTSKNVVPCPGSGKIAQENETWTQMDGDVEDKDVVSPSMLEQLVEEAKKQVNFEEQTLVESLSRQRESLKKMIEDRESAEHSTISQDKK